MTFFFKLPLLGLGQARSFQPIVPFGTNNVSDRKLKVLGIILFRNWTRRGFYISLVKIPYGEHWSRKLKKTYDSIWKTVSSHIIRLQEKQIGMWGKKGRMSEWPSTASPSYSLPQFFSPFLLNSPFFYLLWQVYHTIVCFSILPSNFLVNATLSVHLNCHVMFECMLWAFFLSFFCI